MYMFCIRVHTLLISVPYPDVFANGEWDSYGYWEKYPLIFKTVYQYTEYLTVNIRSESGQIHWRILRGNSERTIKNYPILFTRESEISVSLISVFIFERNTDQNVFKISKLWDFSCRGSEKKKMIIFNTRNAIFSLLSK